MCRPSRGRRAREHRGVLAGAVVHQSRKRPSAFAREFRSTRRERLVRSAGEIALFAPDRLQHARCDRDVLGFAAVRSACEREFLFTPADRLESAGREERQNLKEFCARAPHGDQRRIPRDGEGYISRPDDGGVDPVARFDAAAAGDDDVQG
jgi:hypothetical protein